MVRRALLAPVPLRYREAAMDADPTTAGPDSPGAEPDEVVGSRLWSLAAAMEPVPPLAPPPALPGEGVSLTPPPRPAPGGPPGVRGLIGVAVLVAVVALVVILVVVLGR